MKTLCTVFFVFTFLSGAYSQTFWSGSLSGNTTWTLVGSPHIVTGNVTVPVGDTLKVDSGATVRFQSNTGLYVRGKLSARQATFTSSHDVGGDTPAKGDWNYIQIGDGSGAGSATFDTCKIKYGGTTSFPSDNCNVYIYWGSASFNFCDISASKNYGIMLYTSGTVTIKNSNIFSCDWPLSYVGPGSLIFNGSNNFSGNTHNGVYMRYGNNGNALVLDTVNVPYTFYNNYTVDAGGSLTIASTNMLKFVNGAYLNINGTLIANAGSGQTIYFTAYVDDNVGGDTNGDGTSTTPSTNYWGGIAFLDPSLDGSCLMRRCKVTFAGYGSVGGISMYNASPTIDSCNLANNYYGAMMQSVSNPTFTNNTIGSSQLVPIAMSFSANPVFTNNTFSFSDNAYDAIGLLGGTLPASSVLPIRSVTSIPNVTYLLLQSVTVPAAMSLTINPGIVIKGYSYNQYIYVQGKLIANASADNMITITSSKDDNFGHPGDTNKDGTQTVPAVGDWGGIIFEQGSDTLSTLNFCRLKYGNVPSFYYNGVYLQGEILTNNASPVVSNCELTNVVYGLTLFESSNPKIQNDTITNAQYTPIALSVAANPSLSGIRFINAGYSALGIIGENLGFNGKISKRDVAGFTNITYVLLGNLGINSGTNVSVDPGVVIKSGGPGIYVSGGFQAKGTITGGQIVFTSLRDDNYGNPGDTNGDGAGSAPNRGDWSTIQFLATSDDIYSKLDSCLIKYAGSNIGGVTYTNAGSTFSNSTLSDINNYGIECDGGSTPNVFNVNIINCRLDPLAMSLTSNPNFGSGITFSANGSSGIRILEGTLSSNATLARRDVAGITNIAYIVDGLTVAANAVLTINPGVVIKFVGGYSYISVSGALIANGTVDQKIIFTSLSDDSNGGDTNNDGNASAPARGNWSVVDFASSAIDTLNSLKYCELRYGGNTVYSYPNYYGSIRVYNAKAKVDNCIIQQSGSSALGVFGSAAPTFSNLQINNVSSTPVTMSMFSNPSFSNITALNVGLMALGIIAETYSVTDTVPVRNFSGNNNITYFFFGTSTINSGTTITIPAGVVFKGQGSNFFNVNGALISNGTAAQPVVFTDYRDDSYGNPFDTNQDGSGSVPSINGAAHIYFSDISNDAANTVKHTIFRYASWGCYTLSASPVIVGCTFDHDNWGLYLGGVSQPVLDSCQFNNLVYGPFTTSLVSYPISTVADVISGTTYRMIGVLQETLVQDVTLTKHNFAGINNIPYLFPQYTIGSGATLTINPGVILKFFGGGYIDVQKGLLANGGSTADSTIVFTGFFDDFYGGDSNSDSTITGPGYYNSWSGIIFENQSLDPICQLKNCVIRYAGAYSNSAGVTMNNASPTITYCSFTQNWNGITANGASNPILNYCDIYKNQSKGIQNTNLSFNIDARNNWWGNNTGPTHKDNPGGTGDIVTDSVRYSPYRTTNAQDPLMGDVSLNGSLQAFDATAILKYSVDPIGNPLNTIQQHVADVSGSGGITSTDASLVLQYVVGNILYFPIIGTPETTPIALPKAVVSSFEIGTVSGSPGSTITVPIRANSLRQLAGADIRLQYNHAYLTPKEVTLASGAVDFMLASHFSEDHIAIGLASSKISDIDGEILNVTFVINNSITGQEKSPITFERLLLNEHDMLTLAQNGAVSVSGKPVEFALQQNYPNPFNPSTTIRFDVPTDRSHVSLVIFNELGEIVRTLLNETRDAGSYEIAWDGKNQTGAQVGSGIYFYRFVGKSAQQEFSTVKKMLLMK